MRISTVYWLLDLIINYCLLLIVLNFDYTFTQLYCIFEQNIHSTKSYLCAFVSSSPLDDK